MELLAADVDTGSLGNYYLHTHSTGIPLGVKL